MTKTVLKKPDFLSKIKLTKKQIITTIIIIIAVLFLVSKLQKPEVKTSIEYREATASIDSIIQTLDSSGTIEVYETFSLSPTVTGDILTANVALAGEVVEGQVLYTIDNANAQTGIDTAQTALEKQQSSYQDALDALADLNIKAPINGTIMNVLVSKGDTVSSSTVIANYTDLSTLEVSLPFHSANAKNISVGDVALVTVNEFGEVINGIVTGVSNGEYILDTGVLVSEVCIEVQNPGVLTDNYTASVTINDMACALVGDFTYKYSGNITAGTSGEITSLNIMKGDYVLKNQVVAVVLNETLKDNLDDAKSSLDDAISNHQDALDALNDYIITSPIDGTILEKSYSDGDTISNANNTTLAVVADMTKMKFQMVVDELNVSKISLNSPVVVTADAIADTTFDGYIESISMIGSQSSGVTTYPIVVVLENVDGLLPGMNVTADIIIEQAVDEIVIPSSYVSRGNTVLISSTDAQKYQTSTDGTVGTVAPSDIDGYHYLYVELGISNGTSVVITNGLSEGTKIYMQVITVTTTESDTEEFGLSIPGMSDRVTSNSTSDRVTSGTTTSGPRG
ncbi:MAG: efflux RND transporter periplasmic adaptor subunit [Clostridia bacterium]